MTNGTAGGTAATLIDHVVDDIVTTIGKYLRTLADLARLRRVKAAPTAESSEFAVPPITFFALSLGFFVVAARVFFQLEQGATEVIRDMRSTISDISTSNIVIATVPALLTLLLVGAVASQVVRHRDERDALRRSMLYLTGLLLVEFPVVLLMFHVYDSYFVFSGLGSWRGEVISYAFLTMPAFCIGCHAFAFVFHQIWRGCNTDPMWRRIVSVAWRSAIAFMAPIAALCIYVTTVQHLEDQHTVRVLPLGVPISTIDDKGQRRLQIEVIVDNRSDNVIVISDTSLALLYLPCSARERFTQECRDLGWKKAHLLQVVQEGGPQTHVLLEPHARRLLRAESMLEGKASDSEEGVGVRLEYSLPERRNYTHVLIRRWNS